MLLEGHKATRGDAHMSVNGAGSIELAAGIWCSHKVLSGPDCTEDTACGWAFAGAYWNSHEVTVAEKPLHCAVSPTDKCG